MDRIDHTIDSGTPTPERLQDILKNYAERHKDFLGEKSDRDIIRLVFGRLKMSGKRGGGRGEEEQKGNDPTSLNSEQVAEQEQEQEQEQEEEREQEQEQEQESVRPQDEQPLPYNFTRKVFFFS